MKKILLLLVAITFISVNAQDQTINGNVFVGNDIPEKFDWGYKLHFRGCDSSNDPIWMAKYTGQKERTDLRINIGDATDPADRLVVGYTEWNTKKWYENFVISSVGKVGIRVSNPVNALDVNGVIYGNEKIIIGKQVSTSLPSNEEGSIDRLIIAPYRHTGGPWKFVSRDTESYSFIDFNYGDVVKNIYTIKYFNNNSWFGINTKNPQYSLDVNGTIHAREVKIDNNGWADFVFDKDYKLPTIAEVEAHIKEHKRLPEIPSENEVKENGVNIGEMQAKLLQKIEELTLYAIQQQKELEEIKKENKELRELINSK